MTSRRRIAIALAVAFGCGLVTLALGVASCLGTGSGGELGPAYEQLGLGAVVPALAAFVATIAGLATNRILRDLGPDEPRGPDSPPI